MVLAVLQSNIDLSSRLGKFWVFLGKFWVVTDHDLLCFVVCLAEPIWYHTADASLLKQCIAADHFVGNH